MGVTNFTSTVGVQGGSTASIDAVAAALDKVSSSIDKAAERSKNLSQNPSFDAFAGKVKQGITDPLGAIGSAAESALKSIGPLGAGIGATAGVFAAAAVAGYEAAKALGSYATELSNVSVRTGLSIREVQQFSYAARVSGQDVSVFETAMRKLSQGLDENNESGKKARQGLADLGVQAVDFSGKTLPMSEIFVQISEGLNRIEDPAKRDSEALKVFGRAGIELLPTMLALGDQIKRSKELGGLIGADPAEVAKMKAYQQQVVEIDLAWESLKRSVAKPLAATVSVLFNADNRVALILSALGVPGFAGTLPLRAPLPGEPGGGTTDDSLGPYFPGKSLSRSARTSLLGTQKASINRGNSAIDALLGNDLPKQLEDAKKKLEDDYALLVQKRGSGEQASAEIRAQTAKDQAAVKGLEAQIKAAKDLEEEKKRIIELDKRSAELLASSRPVGGINGEYAAALGKLGVDYRAALAQNPNSTREVNLAFHQQNEALHNTALRKATESLEKFDEQMRESPKIIEESLAKMEENFKLVVKGIGETSVLIDLLKPSKGPLLAGVVSPEQQLRDARDNSQRGLSLFGTQAQLAGVPEVQQIATLASLRKHYADEEFAALARKAAISSDQAALQTAEDEQHQRYLDAEIERQQALLQLAIRQKESIQNFSVGLVNSLESGNAKGFITGQLRGLQDKVISNLVGLAANDISKVIPHANSGILGKALANTPFGPDPLKESGTVLLTAGVRLGIAADHLLAISASGGGGGAVRGVAGIFSGLGATASRSGYSIGSGETAYEGSNLPSPDPGNADTGNEVSRGGLFSGANLSKYGGAAAAGIGGGLAIYSGVQSGGARGAATAVGGALAAAGSIVSLISKSLSIAGPIGAIAGSLVGAIVPALFGDPKAQRAKELDQQAQQRSFTMPTGRDYSVDTTGRYVDSGIGGSTRSAPIYMSINTMDAQSFNDFLNANPHALSSGISNAIAGGNADDVVTFIQQRISPS